MRSSEFFPGSEAPKPPLREGIARLPGSSVPRSRRQNRATAADRGRGRRIANAPALKREDASIDTSASLSAESADTSTAPRRKRGVSRRELEEPEENHSETKDPPENSKKRSRKPPRRVGHDE